MRVFHFDRRPPFVGLCLNVFTKRQINRSCGELLADGFPVVGRYVKRRLPQSDRRIDTHYSLAGRVASIDGNTLRLTDHRVDEDSVLSGEAYLETAAFESVVRHVYGDAADQVMLKLDEQTNELRQGELCLGRLKNDRPFSEAVVGADPRCRISVRYIPVAARRRLFPSCGEMPSVIYVFDATGKKTDTWHDRGLDTHGPYSTPTFTPNEPRICVVCQRQHRGRIEQFVRKLLDGITVPDHGKSNRPKKREPFTKGLIRKYALKNATVEFFETEGESAVAYRKAVQRAIETQTERRYSF